VPHAHQDGAGGRISTSHAHCGVALWFACLFHQNNNTYNDDNDNDGRGKGGGVRGERLRFDGPVLVMEGLWCGQIDAEDGVLAVCEFRCGCEEGGRAVAVGRYSGRLLLVVAAGCEERGRYRGKIFWSCQLLHQMHGIMVSDFGLAGMLVVTRKTVHLFEVGGLDRFKEAAVLRLEDLARSVSRGSVR